MIARLSSGAGAVTRYPIGRSSVVKVAIILVGMLTLYPLGNSTEASPAKSFRDIALTPERDEAKEAQGELRADARELAEVLRIKPLIIMIEKSRRAGAEDATQLPRAVQNARIICLWRLFIASEEVRKVVQAINYDLATSYTALDTLVVKRNMTMNLINTANFLQGGTMGTVKQSLSYPGGFITHVAAQEVGMTTFGLGTALAASTLFVPSFWSRKIDATPNTLAHIFNVSYRPNDADRSYLWRFMNSPIPGSSLNLTRREILLRHWQDLGLIQPGQAKSLARLSALPAQSESMTENIRIIMQRIALLNDLKTHFEEFDGSLFELHKAISID